MAGKHRTLAVAAVVLIALPYVLPLMGLTTSTATQVVVLCIAALGLNMMMGYTGLVSFGHAAWFGIAPYAAADVGAARFEAAVQQLNEHAYQRTEDVQEFLLAAGK